MMTGGLMVSDMQHGGVGQVNAMMQGPNAQQSMMHQGPNPVNIQQVMNVLIACGVKQKIV